MEQPTEREIVKTFDGLRKPKLASYFLPRPINKPRKYSASDLQKNGILLMADNNWMKCFLL
jgi:hypothetical protein